MYDKQKVIDIALAEVGYLEKADNTQLDEKTANAGNKNRTKYARDLDALWFYNTGKQGVQWCDVFVDWTFVRAYGLSAALALTCQALGSAGAGCRYSRGYYKNKGQLFDTPEPGDQVFFWPSNRSDPNAVQHTGLVVAVDEEYVYTVEGNTSGASGVVSNGGGVFQKKYKRGYSRFAGFGRPRWDMDEVEQMARRTIRKGDKGPDVLELQKLLNLDRRYGGLAEDGVFGSGTLSSVRAFQGDNNLTPDGIVGPKTWAVLDKVAQDRPVEAPDGPQEPLNNWDTLSLEEKVENLNERLKRQEGGESDA